jgi:hypothetical protein
MRHNQGKIPVAVNLRFMLGFIFGAIVISGVLNHVFGIDVENHLPGYSLCPFRIITHIPCPGCGMTRAMICLGKLDLAKAIHLNPLSIPLFALMLIYVCNPDMIRISKNELILKILLVMVVVVWILCLYKQYHLMKL